MGFKTVVIEKLKQIEHTIRYIKRNDFGESKEREKERIFAICRDSPKKIKKYCKKYPARNPRDPIGTAQFEVNRWANQQIDLNEDVPF